LQHSSHIYYINAGTTTKSFTDQNHADTSSPMPSGSPVVADPWWQNRGGRPVSSPVLGGSAVPYGSPVPGNTGVPGGSAVLGGSDVLGGITVPCGGRPVVVAPWWQTRGSPVPGGTDVPSGSTVLGGSA